MPRRLVILVMPIAIVLAARVVLFSPGWIERTASDRVELDADDQV